MQLGIDALALLLRAIWLGDNKVAMSITILPLAFPDISIKPDVSASAVHESIFEPALVDITRLKDEEAFAMWCLSASEDMSDVLGSLASQEKHGSERDDAGGRHEMQWSSQVVEAA